MVTSKLGSLFALVDVPEGKNVLDRYEHLEGLTAITTKWRIGKTVQVVRVALNEAAAPREEILAKYGTRTSPTMWNIPNEKMAGYLEEIRQLNETTIELAVEPLEMSLLDNTNIVTADLMKLHDAKLVFEKT